MCTTATRRVTDTAWQGMCALPSLQHKACHKDSRASGERAALPAHRLQLYPDRMYGFWPEQLPASDAKVTPSFANDVRLEVGGFLREREEFPPHRAALHGRWSC